MITFWAKILILFSFLFKSIQDNILLLKSKIISMLCYLKKYIGNGPHSVNFLKQIWLNIRKRFFFKFGGIVVELF